MPVHSLRGAGRPKSKVWLIGADSSKPLDCGEVTTEGFPGPGVGSREIQARPLCERGWLTTAPAPPADSRPGCGGGSQSQPQRP